MDQSTDLEASNPSRRVSPRPQKAASQREQLLRTHMEMLRACGMGPANDCENPEHALVIFAGRLALLCEEAFLPLSGQPANRSHPE